MSHLFTRPKCINAGCNNLAACVGHRKGTPSYRKECRGCRRRRTGKRAHLTATQQTSGHWVWRAIIGRCYNMNYLSYHNYGGRGITVCDAWRNDFWQFVADMGPRPSPKHSIDRYPNQNGNYEPGNCRWATPKEQSRNKRNNHLLTFNNTTRTLIEWSETQNLKPGTVRMRLLRGQSIEEALTTPVYRSTRRNQSMTTKELHDYIENEGIERALYKFEGEPTDDDELADLFHAVAEVQGVFDNLAAVFCEIVKRRSQAHP